MNLPDLDLKAEKETIAFAKPLEQTADVDTSVVSATSAGKGVMANVAYAFLLAGANACRMCDVTSKSYGVREVQLDEGRVFDSFETIFGAAGCIGRDELNEFGDLKKVAAVITKWAKVSVKRRMCPASSSVLFGKSSSRRRHPCCAARLGRGRASCRAPRRRTGHYQGLVTWRRYLHRRVFVPPRLQVLFEPPLCSRRRLQRCTFTSTSPTAGPCAVHVRQRVLRASRGLRRADVLRRVRRVALCSTQSGSDA
jgi:hypothetical protein